MNPAIIAAVIKKYGNHVAGGEYEIFVPLADVQSIPPGSGMREYRDLQRDGFVIRLLQLPRVIDITATVTDTGGNPLVKATPVQPPPAPEPDPLTNDPVFQTLIDSASRPYIPPRS